MKGSFLNTFYFTSEVQPNLRKKKTHGFFHCSLDLSWIDNTNCLLLHPSGELLQKHPFTCCLSRIEQRAQKHRPSPSTMQYNFTRQILPLLMVILVSTGQLTNAFAALNRRFCKTNDDCGENQCCTYTPIGYQMCLNYEQQGDICFFRSRTPVSNIHWVLRFIVFFRFVP